MRHGLVEYHANILCSGFESIIHECMHVHVQHFPSRISTDTSKSILGLTSEQQSIWLSMGLSASGIGLTTVSFLLYWTRTGYHTDCAS